MLLYKKYYSSLIGFFAAAQVVANICCKFFTRALFFIFYIAIRTKDCVKKNQFDAQLILGIFRQPLHVWAYLGPTSGGTNVCIQKLELTIIFR